MAAPPLAQPVLLFRSELAAGSGDMLQLSNPQSTPLSHSPNQPLSPTMQPTQVDDSAVEDEYASFTSESCQPIAAAALQAVTSSSSSTSVSSNSNSNSNSHSLSPSLTHTTDTDSDQSNTPKKHRSSGKSHKKSSHHHHHHHPDTDIDDSSSKKKRSSSDRSKSDRDASDKEGSRSGSKRSKEVSIAPPVVAAPALRFTPSGLSSSPPGSLLDPRDRSRSPMSSSSSTSSSSHNQTRPTRSASTASTSSISPQSFLDLTGVGSDTHNLIRGSVAGSSSSSSISSMDGATAIPRSKPKPNPAPKYDTFGDHPRPVDHSSTLANVSDLSAWLRQHGFDSQVREKCILGHHNSVADLLKTTKMELKNLLGVKDGIRMFHLLRDVETAHAALTSSSHSHSSSSRPRISPASFLPPSANSAIHSHHSTTLSHSRELHQPGMYGYCSCMDCDLPAANSCALKHCERSLCVAHSNKNLLTGSIVCAECYSKMTYMENIKGAMGITALEDAGYQVNQCSIQ